MIVKNEGKNRNHHKIGKVKRHHLAYLHTLNQRERERERTNYLPIETRNKLPMQLAA